MSDIETRLFRYFVAVAEEQHFARAALRLGITPQTLTHQIKKLEDQLAARPLERKGNRGVSSPSQAGAFWPARAKCCVRSRRRRRLPGRPNEESWVAFNSAS